MLFLLTAAATAFCYVIGTIILVLVSVALGEPSPPAHAKDFHYVGPIIERGHIDIIA